jgi:hypothetical protein
MAAFFGWATAVQAVLPAISEHLMGPKFQEAVGLASIAAGSLLFIGFATSRAGDLSSAAAESHGDSGTPGGADDGGRAATPASGGGSLAI